MKPNRLLLTIALIVALLSAGGYGTYRYLLNRYAADLDGIISDLLQSAGTDQVAGNPTPQVAVTPAPAPSTTAPSTPTPGTQSGEPKSPPATPPTGGTSGVIDKATSSLNLSASEQTKAESADELLEKMSTTEKMMVLKTLNRFSVSELLEMYRIYNSGDAEQVAAIKAKIKAQFSAADIDLIKSMASKYR